MLNSQCAMEDATDLELDNGISKLYTLVLTDKD